MKILWIIFGWISGEFFETILGRHSRGNINIILRRNPWTNCSVNFWVNLWKSLRIPLKTLNECLNFEEIFKYYFQESISKNKNFLCECRSVENFFEKSLKTSSQLNLVQLFMKISWNIRRNSSNISSWTIVYSAEMNLRVICSSFIPLKCNV